MIAGTAIRRLSRRRTRRRRRAGRRSGTAAATRGTRVRRPRVRSRGSRIATTPRSPWPRISRPKPCRSCSTAVGSEYSRNQSPPPASIRSQRASTSGSPGAAERQLVDHEQRQRLARHVDPLPERRRRDEHRVGVGAEALEQALARRVALDEHVVRDTAADAGGDRVERAVRARQDERAPARERAERDDLVGDPLERARRPRVGHRPRDVEQRLPA